MKPKPTDLCRCGHTKAAHAHYPKQLAGCWLITGWQGEGIEKSPIICPCRKFTPARKAKR